MKNQSQMQPYRPAPFVFPVLSFFAALAWGVCPAVSQDDLGQPVVAEVAEELIAIDLKEQQIVDHGRGITQVFLLSNKDQIHDSGEAKNIVKPKEASDKEAAYFRVYFSGREGKVENGVIVLVLDYRSEQPTYFVDQNNNLDFTDDPKTETIPVSGGGFGLELFGDKEGSKFAIQFMPFQNEKDLTEEKKDQFAQMFEGFRSHMGGEFTDANFWYFNRRLSTRTNSVEVDGSKVMLGLHDYDCDGHYSGEKDRLLVGEYGGEHISYALADGAVNVRNGEVFLIGDQPYRIVDAASDGSRIRIEKSETMPDRLFVGMEVPSLSMKAFDGGKSVQVESLLEPGRFLVLDFWGHWCGPCIATIPACIEFHDKWKDKVTFVGVHHGDHAAATKIVTEKKVPWPQYECSDELIETFFVDGWPTYVLINEQGKLVSFRSSLKDMAKLLEGKAAGREKN